jgi:hypothetical protein
VKTFIFVVVLAAAAWWGYRHGYLKPEWIGLGKPTTSAAPAGSGGESLQATLNRGLPRMVASDVSLDRAVANNVVVTYDYRMVDLDQYAVAQRYGSTLPADMRGALIQDLCANRAIREQVLAGGREIQLQIHAQDGRTMFTTQLRPGGC